MTINVAPSAGRRLVMCDRPDCEHCGDVVALVVLEHLHSLGHPPPWYWCTAEFLGFDRRASTGAPCATYVRRSSGT